ncbi:bypass of stop codon protein 1 [Drosophila serrata]|uniref:bypass of stop codon protein 1 n=1 Tax=Drosophila serrata TaxID=7274 RepID=UPI000A1D1CA1|nr:bypass of stop codon protein 1 [Drosophila serrata]KAH8376319.1 hypothetical protein KR200_007646 [Drosophila serrata]
MTAFNQDQHFALLFIFSLMGGTCLFDITQAQTLTAEDRLSVLKFVGAFMNFLDLELENSTMATPGSTSTTSSVETTSIPSSSDSTEVTTEATESSNSTTTIVESSSSSSSSESSTDPGTTTEATTTTVRRRMCFKRFCYKFSSDKGYIV